MIDNHVNIKKAAEILGVTAQTLRNWEKQGKLVPKRHPMNNYRIYKITELKKLLKGIQSP